MKNTRHTGHSARTALATTALALCGIAWNAEAQFSITTGTGNTAQNFDTLAITGAIAGGVGANSWLNDTTLAAGDSTLNGWSLFTYLNGPITTYGANTGSSGTGGFYSFGSTTTDTERALGGIASANAYFGTPVPASGAVAGYIAFAATNNSASTLTSFTLGFDGEQWRNGGNTSAQSMVLEYGFGATFSTVATWVQPGGTFNWASPVTGAAATAVSGNVAGLVAGRGGLINGLNWLNGDTLWLRWIENNDAGSDHGLAIDNFSISWLSGTPPKNLLWTPTSDAWDTTATNWKNTINNNIVAFAATDSVTFDDTGLAHNNVAIPVGGVAPGGVTVDTTGTYTLSGGPISASSALQKNGTGTLVVASAYSLGLAANAGTVRTGANEVFGNTSAILVGNGATFDLNGNTETVGALNLTGATITTGAGLLTLGGNVTVAASPTDAPTTISGNLSNGAITRNYTVADSLAPEDLILSAKLTGSGRVNFDGPGTVRISGDNSAFGGGLQMGAGATYILGSANVLGTGQLFLNGGTVQAAVDLTGANKLTAPVSLGTATTNGPGSVTFTGSNIEFSGALSFFRAGTKTFTVSAGQTLTFSGTLDSSQQPGQTAVPGSQIIKEGDGKFVIAGTATLYASTLTANAGRVDIDTALGTGGASIRVGAAVVNISAPQTLADLTIDDGGKVTLGSPLPPAPELSDDAGGLAGESPIAVPEPGCGMLLLGGLAALLGLRRHG